MGTRAFCKFLCQGWVGAGAGMADVAQASNQTYSQLPTVEPFSFSFSRQDPRLLVSQARVFD
jgi:hypothetical protein